MVATPQPGSNEGRLDVDGTPQTVGGALERVFAALEGAELFYGHGTDNPWDEAVQLVLCACRYPVDAGEAVLSDKLDAMHWKRIVNWVSLRVEQRLPLPYITGEAWFAGLRFHCDRRALVPRSPLAELILRDFAPWWTGPNPPSSLLDLCCGGGAIGIAAAVMNPELQLSLADIDADALSLAGENVAAYKLQSRASLFRSDLFTDIPQQQFDIILSNPPYVDAGDMASMPEEYRSEPQLGLASGQDGLVHTRAILCAAADYLTDRGLLFVEVGNSWLALDRLLERYPLTWLEFESGGHGVFVLRREELPAVIALL